MKAAPRPAHKKPPPLTPLEKRMRERAAPSEEAFKKAFGGTKSVGVPDGAVGVRCTQKRETEAAILVVIKDVGEVWVPKSIAQFDESQGLLHVAEWFARREGLL